MPTTMQIAAVDDFQLTATLYEPATAARGTVIINSAMGVKQSYYGPFAQYVADQGFTALTWDYRGVAASRPGPAGEVRLRDWAELDMEGALRWALQRDEPVAVLGHSLGTQLLGLVPSATKVVAVVGVASQSGDWRNWPFPWNAGMFLLSHLALPGVTSLLGKFPAGLMGEELPRGPVKDWARWIRSRGYLLSEGEAVAKLYARLTCPMTGFSIDDDHYAPRQTVDALYAIYASAPVERIHLRPKDLGVKSLGHFGAFRTRFKSTLWPMFLRPLAAALEPLSRAG